MVQSYLMFPWRSFASLVSSVSLVVRLPAGNPVGVSQKSDYGSEQDSEIDNPLFHLKGMDNVLYCDRSGRRGMHLKAGCAVPQFELISFPWLGILIWQVSKYRMG